MVKLNSSQQKAVEYNDGPLLIVAGAGTGKTTVITEKIKYLIENDKAETSEILALTFTEKAADEMEERVDVALPYGYTDTWIMTFHSFCDRILQDEAIHIGLNSAYQLMSQAEAVQLLRDNIFGFDLDYFRPLGNPTKFVTDLLHHFSRLQDEDVSPEAYLAYARQKEKDLTDEADEEKQLEAVKTKELAGCFQQYQELKIKEGVMDFGDLIANVLQLFRQRPNVLQRYRKNFKAILVDEFQDTNIAQYELLKLLAPAGNRPVLSVVADDSQSIYRFRGAAMSNVLQFMDDYAEAESIVLLKNYRSTQPILDSAYQLIQQNNPDTLEAKLGISKDLKSVSGNGETPQLLYAQKVEDEAEEVVNTIQQLKDKEGYGNEDFAILVRANRHADPFIRCLKRHNIPYQFLGPGQLFRQPEVKDLIAYLQVLDDLTADQSFYRLLCYGPFELSGRSLNILVNFARQANLSLFRAAEEIGQLVESENGAEPPGFPQKDQEKLKQLVKTIYRHLELVKQETAGQILYYFLEDSGLLEKMTQAESRQEEKQIKNISRFFDRLNQYEVTHEEARVPAIVEWIDMALDLGDSPLSEQIDWFEEDRVNILTIHSAKGLEFPVVFLVNLVPGRFPTYHRRQRVPIPQDLIKEILPEGDFHEEEERRLFYVGMTRAEERLYMTASKYYASGKRARKVSPFVFEALGEEKVTGRKATQSDQLSIFKYQPEEQKEEKSPRPGQERDYFSYSQLNTFAHCPAQYRWKYLQKVPTAPTEAQNFGSIIHQTLYDFYRRQLNLFEEGKEAADWATKENLLALFDKNWRGLGFSSKAYEKRLKREGEQMLVDFFEEEFSPQDQPVYLEKRFTLPLDEEVKVGGIFDRVDKKEDKFEIIDYKTGKTKDKKEAKKSLQMKLYALAATSPGILGARPENLQCTFHFLKEKVKRTVSYTAEELEAARSEALEEIEEIKDSDFAPTPGFWCDFCPYKMVCDAWR